MMGLSDSERISMMRSAVLIQYTRVTDDRRTDGLGVAYAAYAVVRKNPRWQLTAILELRRCRA